MLICAPQLCTSQIKGDQVWIAGYQKNFGELGGFDTHIMDFRKDSMSVEYYNSPMGLAGNNASIFQSLGNMLLYTNGRAVMNSNHGIISNGMNINDGE